MSNITLHKDSGYISKYIASPLYLIYYHLHKSTSCKGTMYVTLIWDRGKACKKPCCWWDVHVAIIMPPFPCTGSHQSKSFYQQNTSKYHVIKCIFLIHATFLVLQHGQNCMTSFSSSSRNPFNELKEYL